VARNITESIPLNIGNPGTTGFWTNRAETYDVAIGGMPFFMAPTDTYPYQRETAPYRKDQFDSSTEPGEQSLTGWWIRSQSSFHAGDGVNFYEPGTNDTTAHNRFADSKGVNVWNKGEVSLLKTCNAGHITTEDLQPNKRPWQSMRSIEWGTNKGVLMHDGYDVDKVNLDGVETHFINFNAGQDYPVYAICDDGTTAYFATNRSDSGTPNLYVFKKPLTGDHTSGVVDNVPSGDVTKMFSNAGTTITNAVMEYVKERIVACINNKVYEWSPTASGIGTAIYEHPSTNHIYTSIAASGPAIYVAGYNGIQSTIQKFTLKTDGAMPVLNFAVTAAELPVGEVVHKIYYYLGYMMIGTNKGVRVASINETDGSLLYGPLIVETVQPVYDFAARDRFVWCAASVAGEPGTIRIDLSNQVEPLRFAWANDVYYVSGQGRQTTSCAFIDGTNRLAFTSQGLTKGTKIVNKQLTANVATISTQTAHGFVVGDLVWVEGVDSTFNSAGAAPYAPFTITAVTSTTFSYAKTSGNVPSTAVTSTAARAQAPGAIYIESETELMTSGYVTTGKIRFGTLEPKHFKFVRGRGDFRNGAMDIQVQDAYNNLYDIITYGGAVGSPEVATTSPEGSQEYLSYKFLLSRSTTNSALGPVFKGYQIKALPATKGQRLIQFPVWCFDIEKDRFNVVVGYKGRAWERIQAFEELEATRDIVNVQDFTVGERVQGVIEKVNFSRKAPPNGDFDGFGGVLMVTVRTVL
jgi:hypothetical protein